DILGGYAYHLVEEQGLTEYCCLKLTFGGFYSQSQLDNQHFKELGQAALDLNKKEVIISFNRIFLFNKLGYERYLTSPNTFLDISFANLTKTISHELAHYIQFIKYGESSCESDLKL